MAWRQSHIIKVSWVPSANIKPAAGRIFFDVTNQFSNLVTTVEIAPLNAVNRTKSAIGASGSFIIRIPVRKTVIIKIPNVRSSLKYPEYFCNCMFKKYFFSC